MTDKEKSKEPIRNIIIPTHRNKKYVDLTETVPIFGPQFIPQATLDTTKEINLSFSEGTSRRCLDQIGQYNDIMETRNRIQVAQESGKILREALEEARGCTAGVVVKSKHPRLGLAIKYFVKEGK